MQPEQFPPIRPVTCSVVLVISVQLEGNIIPLHPLQVPHPHQLYHRIRVSDLRPMVNQYLDITGNIRINPLELFRRLRQFQSPYLKASVGT